MKLLFENRHPSQPLLSVILLDWSCRESYHVLQYLSHQNIPRETYEVIWIEYYNRRPHAIEVALQASGKADKPPVVDQWIVMGMPDHIYYHKHLMYNVGIIASKGRIVTFCDSDAMMEPTFISSIITSFEEDPNLVLHLDEVRNDDRRYYPFNHPSIQDIKGKRCINWKDGKTLGLHDREDPLHTRNYGACMSALRDDLIQMGGADEHKDYLGHICGPYEMTFRLLNTGKKEQWHQQEFLYHAWHPGTDGRANFMGPHDGRNMSTTALQARWTGRVLPLVENPAIRLLRLKQDDILYAPLLSQAIPQEDLKHWTVTQLSERKDSRRIAKRMMKHPMATLQLATTFFRLLIKQFHMKATTFSRRPTSLKDLFRKCFKIRSFLQNMVQYNTSIVERCTNSIKELVSHPAHEVALYGTGDVAEVLYTLALDSSLSLTAVFDECGGKQFHGMEVKPLESIRTFQGKVILATLVGIEEKVAKLKHRGVTKERMVIL